MWNSFLVFSKKNSIKKEMTQFKSFPCWEISFQGEQEEMRLKNKKQRNRNRFFLRGRVGVSIRAGPELGMLD
jgi:hypothetical protein